MAALQLPPQDRCLSSLAATVSISQKLFTARLLPSSSASPCGDADTTMAEGGGREDAASLSAAPSPTRGLEFASPQKRGGVAGEGGAPSSAAPPPASSPTAPTHVLHEQLMASFHAALCSILPHSTEAEAAAAVTMEEGGASKSAAVVASAAAAATAAPVLPLAAPAAPETATVG